MNKKINSDASYVKDRREIQILKVFSFYLTENTEAL